MAGKTGREMTKLTPQGKAEMRELLVARELAKKEERENPVVLSNEQNRLAITPELSPGTREQATPAQPERDGPGKRRR